MNISQSEESCFCRQKLCGSWVLTDPVCPEKVVVVVVVMAELNGGKLLCVLRLMWCTLPFSKLSSNLISVRMAR